MIQAKNLKQARCMTGLGKPWSRAARRARRKEEADERNLHRELFGDEQQIAHLKRSGYGHCREVERLRARIAARAA